MLYWLPGIIAFVIAFSFVPILRRCALRWHFVDMPNARKIHHDPLPLLGGVAIFTGFLAAGFIYSMTKHALPKPYIGVFIGAAILFAIGLVDDYYKTRKKDFSAGIRFVLQIISAVLVASFGGTVHGFTSPFGHHNFVQLPYILSLILTVVWIVGVINVFNFLDGVDGLAAGIAAISACTLLFIAILKGDTTSAVLASCLMGASLGFLRHNFYPARIIMGDSGSTVLGFLLASISVVGAFKSATLVSIVVPVLALGVPIFDGIRVVIERALAGKPVYKPDQNHGHHRLLRAGFSQVQTVAVMYIVSACFSLASMIVVLLAR
jgi:UDP-GlcNAc:undecaprenyl-phosphate/decaprenyl-phosphate GlcNAc-1-phosphate transferase